MTFYIDQQILIFWVLVLCVVAFFGGWVTKISIDQYRADRKREQEAEMRRMTYMHQRLKQKRLEEQHKLWDSNMKETADVFEEETKGGAKKMSIFRTDDPIADFDRYDAEQSRQEEKLPECSECGEKVQDEYFYEINDEVICSDCLDSNHRKWVEDYVS